MKCNSKLIYAMRTIEHLRGTLQAASKNRHYMMDGEKHMMIRLPAVEEIVKVLGSITSDLHEVVTNDSQDGE